MDELEAEINISPHDVSLKEELAGSLVDRYIYGDDTNGAGSEADIKRLREVLSALPEEKAPYCRAYVAYLDKNDEEAADWLLRWAKTGDPGETPEPFSADELKMDLIEPFAGASNGFWSKLADALQQLWPDSAAALTLKGYVEHSSNSLDVAIDSYERALRKESDYWVAAWGLAEAHQANKNWEAASQYYERALQSEVGRAIAELHFYAAWCSGRLGNHTDEERYYRQCLELNREYPYARNNLGWSLYRQGRFEEALPVFDDCVERKLAGAYPLRNRARTLAKLGRLSEAIEAWKRTAARGRLSKNAQEQIAKLQQRINRGDTQSSDSGSEEEEESEDGQGIGTQSPERTRKGPNA